ncbi:MAG: tetratricopeptide repeat protein [Clostridium sp.]|jgi:hypothetical protein|nr:tetratricopeptide repeat protein [Clostridium sp.]
MKRFIAYFMTAVMLLSLIGCNESNSNQSSEYDEVLTVIIGDTGKWTPFETDNGVTFTYSDISENGDVSTEPDNLLDNLVFLTDDGKTVTYTGLILGECIITARFGDAERIALVKVVKEASDSTAAVGSGTNTTGTNGSNNSENSDETETHTLSQMYYNLLLADLNDLDPAAQAEYLLTIGDYMAIAAATRETGSGFTAMAEAATILYPSGYMLNNYATLRMQRSDYDGAVPWLEGAIEVEKGNPVILTNLAECYYALGDYEGAMEMAALAVESEPNYGLAYLLMTCIHLQNGDDMLAIETLFKSYSSVWTETTEALSFSLLEKVMSHIEVGEEMILTPYHIELLYEAASAGTISDGRDTPANQISLPYPADPADCFTGRESQLAAREEVVAYNDSINFYKDYWYGINDAEARQAYCLNFLALYYEYQAAKIGEYEEYLAWEEQMEEDFSEYLYAKSDPIEEELDELLEEIGNTNTAALAALLVDANKAEKLSAEAQRLQKQYDKTEAERYITLYSDAHVRWQSDLATAAQKRKEYYESQMRPLLEEYALRMNAMLGYVADEDTRLGFESRMAYYLNQYALIDPLYLAAYDDDMANDYLEKANQWRFELQQKELEAAKQRDALINANKTENGQLKDFIEKEEGFLDNRSVTLTLPIGANVSVSVGFEGTALKFGYGAFGHEIIHSWDTVTGNRTQTILTTTSIWPFEVEQLATLSVEMVDILSGSLPTRDEDLMSEIDPVGSLPSFDFTKTEGKTYTFNARGEQIDVARIREGRMGVSWGAIEVGITREGYLSSSTSYKGDLTFGLLTFQ